MISNVTQLVFITAAIVLSLKEQPSFLFSHIVCVTVNSVDAGTSLVTGSSTNVAAYFLRLCCVFSSLAFNNYNLLKNL